MRGITKGWCDSGGGGWKARHPRGSSGGAGEKQVLRFAQDDNFIIVQTSLRDGSFVPLADRGRRSQHRVQRLQCGQLRATLAQGFDYCFG